MKNIILACSLILTLSSAGIAAEGVNNELSATKCFSEATGFDQGYVLVAMGTPPPNPPSGQSCCYCGGKNWQEGSIACMGGFKHVCISCGWATKKLGNDPIRCDGGESCK